MDLGVGVVLAAANVLNNRLVGDDDDGRYVAACMIEAGTLVALARTAGHTWHDLGLDPRRARRDGLRVGLTTAGALLAVGAAAVGVSARARAGLNDERVARRGKAGAVRAALVRVPLGTVMLEEIAFRSVLPAVVARRIKSRRLATAVTATAFGLWHVLPSLDLHRHNQAVGALTRTRATTVGAAVASTAAAHVAFAWLRNRSGSVVAPAIVHWAFNGAGYLAAGLSSGASRSGRSR